MVISRSQSVAMNTTHPQTSAKGGQCCQDQTRSLQEIKTLAQRDEAFAQALKACSSTQEATHVARRRGISVSPEALWRHRGTLLAGGMPTWRG